MKKFTLLPAIIFAAICLQAQIIHIPADYPTIQQGIDTANNGDTVLVAPGTYLEILNFNGKNITVASYLLTTADTSFISQTVIDGDSLGTVVKFHGGEDSTALLMGFTIRNGYNETSQPGGGISIINASPMISCLLITGNKAVGYITPVPFPGSYWNFGGGIYCEGSSSKLNNLEIIDNEVIIGSGGGICCCSNSDVVLYNIKVENNSPEGVILSHSDATLSDVNIFSNTGCGLSCENSNPVFDPIDRCNIYMNSGTQGSDLSSNTSLHVILDTFTVLQPTAFHASPFENFTFNILHGKVAQVSGDLYFSPSGDNSNSGLSLNDPIKSIFHGLARIIADSLNPGIFHLDTGTYSHSTTGDNFPLRFMDYISLDGISEDSVIIDGEGIGTVIYLEDHENFQMEDVTISGGYGEQGGGLHVKSSSLVIRNVTIENNGSVYGGGIYLYNSSCSFQDVVLTENTADYGGGIYLWGDNEITMTNSNIHSNNSNYISGGAGIRNNGSAILDLENVSISYNDGTAITNNGDLHLYGSGDVSIKSNESYYGGIYCMSGYSYLNNINVSGSEQGIRVYQNGSPWPTLILENSKVSQNSGNGVYALRAYLTFNNVSITDNNGGGIHCGMSGITMRNCCLSGNTADQGGGLYMGSGNANLFNVTVTGNTADSFGGIYANASCNVKMVNCISYFNSPDDISGNFNISYSNIYGGYDGTGNIDEDPLFEGSGPFPYQLSAGSPCIDAGREDISGLSLGDFDLIGNYRLWDGDYDGDTIVDMGAYEFGSVGVSTPELQVPGSGCRVEVFPNPFFEIVHFEFEIRYPSPVRIQVFNAVGKLLAELSDGIMEKGLHQLIWNAANLPAGLYFCKVQMGQEVVTKKIVKL